jgi:fatty-acyl-CoA synthase
MSSIKLSSLSERFHDFKNNFSTFICFHGKQKVETIKYNDIYRHSVRISNHIRSNAPPSCEYGFICLKHTPDLIYSFFACILSGLIPCFIAYPNRKQDPEIYWDEQLHVLNTYANGVVITYDEVKCHLDDITSDDFVLLDIDQCRTDCIEQQELREMPKDFKVLQHSSGTTNYKKGMLFQEKVLLDHITNYSNRLGIEQNDKIATWLPLYHDMGLIATFLIPFYLSIETIMLDPFEWVQDPSMLLRTMDKNKATMTWLPNFAFDHIAKRTRNVKDLNLSHVKCFINCSEPCKKETFENFHKKFESCGVELKMLQCTFGMAEGIFAITQTEIGKEPKYIEQDEQYYVSQGKPIDGVELKIERSTRDGCKGEILIKSSFCVEKYAKSESSFIDEQGYYRSGDIGFMADGELYVCGRIKEVVIINGKNYFHNDIEHMVNNLNCTKPGRTVSLSRYNEQSLSEELFILTEGEDKESIKDSIQAEIYNRLGLVARRIIVVGHGKLIKTTSGKLSRKENIKLLNQMLNESK